MIDRFLSPKGADQPFIWFASYENQELITEFEDDGRENSFYSIDKSRIKEFGLLGRKAKLFYDSNTGVFNIVGHKVEFLLELDDGKVIPLTKQPEPYNDIITYKSAYTDYNLTTKQTCSYIDAYFFGYKHSFARNDGMEIHSKIIFSLPMDDTMHFGIRLATNKDISGKLITFIDGEATNEFNIDVQKNEATEIEWPFIY